MGETVDFWRVEWRVEAVQPGRLLRLRAEMLLPHAFIFSRLIDEVAGLAPAEAER